jgi:hypothetical protein
MVDYVIASRVSSLDIESNVSLSCLLLVMGLTLLILPG